MRKLDLAQTLVLGFPIVSSVSDLNTFEHETLCFKINALVPRFWRRVTVVGSRGRRVRSANAQLLCLSQPNVFCDVRECLHPLAM